MIKATISGRGPFPFDMLRYDMAFPATTGDAQILGNIPNHGNFQNMYDTWTLQVFTCAKCFTEARWNSFGVGIKVED